ncbi:bacteriophage holin [Natronococcus sp. A-GB1]|uniref:bacteriophage holin n=1 Tax=Natronococcus sp. A-GB1 TaxID=3037648 RepID=UPI00241DEA96|nr:bacteriophage holin [Natronococcus sp. A-GB1]MDG5761990.1 bacteriophage holin [Natronococcus sp. A-GB1]
MSDSQPSVQEQTHASSVETTELTGKVDARALGLSAGIIWGTAVAFLELAAGTKYGERWRLLLADLYPGYSPEPGDLVWGTVLGFVDAFVIGYLFGRLYNRLAE